jgi:hypothetical protein
LTPRGKVLPNLTLFVSVQVAEKEAGLAKGYISVSHRTNIHMQNKTVAQFMPSFSVFKKARHHIEFKEVTKRSRHYHCLCSTCPCLNERRLKGFENNENIPAAEVV